MAREPSVRMMRKRVMRRSKVGMRLAHLAGNSPNRTAVVIPASQRDHENAPAKELVRL